MATSVELCYRLHSRSRQRTVGLVLAAVPCIGGKILSGMASGPTKWIVGWAMVARGEFAYLVAQTAKDAELADFYKVASDGGAGILHKVTPLGE